MIQEIELLIEQDQTWSAVAGRRLVSIYFGGGTPSLWPAGMVAEVVEAADIAFGVDQECEITLEANPGTVSREALEGYIEAGVNRLSLGIQSLDDRFLKMLGRLHHAGQAVESFELASKAGFENISIDIMFGFPGQTLSRFESDLSRTSRLEPSHVSLYELTAESGTPLEARIRQAREHDPGSEDALAAMLEAADSYLSDCGYTRYEVSNLALPGSECRHNVLYWSGGDYIGIGAAAVTMLQIEKGRAFRHTNTRQPLEYMTKGRQAGTQELLGPVEIAREALLTGLRYREGIDLVDLEARCGRDFLADKRQEVEALVRLGMLETRGNAIAPTRKGMNFADLLALRLSP